MRRVLLALLFSIFAGTAEADENAVAYRLYAEGRYAEAAEIFTDPAWKGAAFYKSDQFWRAAEAFVRADDAVSIYNLGNCYAQLGYYELALQAYLGAQARQPALADAAANADIMRKLIADRDDGGQQGIQPQARKIDEVEAEQNDEGKGSSRGDERGEAEEQRASEDRERTRASSDDQAQTQTAEGRSGDGAKRNEDEGVAGQNDIDGQQGDSEPSNDASGGSRSEAAPQDDQAAGMRTKLESEQATEQWLNRIQDEPVKFLKARIALEARRRAANGNSPPAGGDEW